MQVLSYSFRIFFLATALAGTVLVPLWLLVWNGNLSPSLALPGVLWHAHEMLSGFLSAAIAGFVLTAVSNWTSTPPLNGARLALLAGIWLAARLALFFGWPYAEWLDLLFLPLVTLSVARRVWQARQARQAPVVLVLVLLFSADAAFHMSHDMRFLHGLTLLAALLILVIGGRITPAFSANWLRMQGGDPSAVRVKPAIDRLLMLLMLVVAGCQMLAQTGWFAIAAALAASFLIVVRQVGWRAWLVSKEPLLWILHAGQLWIAAGLLLWAGALSGWFPSTAWVHALGAGAIGTMILGVMTRVSMGHTGRTIRLRRGMRVGYLCIIAAGGLRTATGMGMLAPAPFLWIAALLWSLPFAIFLVSYGPLLLAPRADGRPG